MLITMNDRRNIIEEVMQLKVPEEVAKGAMNMFNMNGTIFDIRRFSTHDGEGIRTTVFFKGCPLNCVWCQNPEGISTKRSPIYFKNRCIKCGICVKLAKNN